MEKPERDTALFGYLCSIGLAIVIYISGFYFREILYNTFLDYKYSLVPVFFMFEMIPFSLLLSGIVNGIILKVLSYHDAAKVSLIIALVAFLIGGTCGLLLVP